MQRCSVCSARLVKPPFPDRAELSHPRLLTKLCGQPLSGLLRFARGRKAPPYKRRPLGAVLEKTVRRSRLSEPLSPTTNVAGVRAGKHLERRVRVGLGFQPAYVFRSDDQATRRLFGTSALRPSPIDSREGLAERPRVSPLFGALLAPPPSAGRLLSGVGDVGGRSSSSRAKNALIDPESTALRHQRLAASRSSPRRPRSKYHRPRLYCASANPCSADLRHQRIASASSFSIHCPSYDPPPFVIVVTEV